MKRRVVLAASGMLAAAVLAYAPRAEAQEIDVEPLGAEELAGMRGGFLLPTGLEAEFGAIARTYSDGVLVLETHFTWTEAGVTRQQTVSSGGVTPSGELPGGFVLQDGAGDTTFAHLVDAAGIRNILLNEASGRDIRVDTQLTVTLPDFDLTQESFTQSLLALHLFDDMAATYP